jgi:hypothetical protein
MPTKPKARARPAAKSRPPTSAKTATTADAPPQESVKVDAFIHALREPHKTIVQRLREIILGVDDRIHEHIKWNHPSFFYAGPMRPFDPKEYKRHMIVFNLHSKDGGVLLVFWRGGALRDTSGFLIGDYADGRRLARFHTLADVKAGAAPLRKVIAKWLSLADT